MQPKEPKGRDVINVGQIATPHFAKIILCPHGTNTSRKARKSGNHLQCHLELGGGRPS